jgi:hypothetical protein
MSPKEIFDYGQRFHAPIDAVTKLAVALPAHINEAQAAGEDPSIIQSARRAQKSIEGNPGSGSQALAIFETLPDDVRVTQAFLDETKNPQTTEGVRLRQFVVQLNAELRQFQALVDDTPIDAMNRIKRELVAAHGSNRQRHHEEAGMPVIWLFVAMAVAALIAYAYHKISLWITVVIVAIAFIVGPLAAAGAAGIARKRKGY